MNLVVYFEPQPSSTDEERAVYAFEPGQVAEIWAAEYDAPPHTHIASINGTSLLGEDGDKRLAEVFRASVEMFRVINRLHKWAQADSSDDIHEIAAEASRILTTIRPFKEGDTYQ